MTSSYALVLVGCGKMGGAMLDGWLAEGVPPQSVLVIDPFAKDLPAGVTVIPSADQMPAGTSAQVVVLAVKPQMMADVLPLYRPLVSPDTVFLSIAAGKTIAFFQQALGEQAIIVRAMPNTPAAIGRGMTVLCAGPGISESQKIHCATLLKATGTVAWLEDEALMDAVTAVSGSGPAYVFHMVEAMAQAGIAMGLPADLSMLLARQTVAGAGELLHQSDLPAGQLRQNVTSPGGTTAAALDILMSADGGLPDVMGKAIAAATRRGKELAG